MYTGLQPIRLRSVARFLTDCSQPNLVLLLSAGAQYGSGATPPAVGPLFAIAGCICLVKESFGCSVALPRR